MASKKARSIRGVLFDWDGTLLDSYAADSSAFLAMFRAMGIPWGLEELARHYSPNWYDVYRAAKLPRNRWPDADLAWRTQYARHCPKLMTGARQALSRLSKDYRLGLVTSGDRDRVLRQLRQFRLTRLFQARVCGGDTAERKPHPRPLQFALRTLCLAPNDCVYVGDSPEDLQMARSAGVRAIAVLGRFPTEKNLRAAKPEFLLESIRDVPGILARLEAGAPSSQHVKTAAS